MKLNILNARACSSNNHCTLSFLFFNNDAMYFFIYTKISSFAKSTHTHTLVIMANKCLFENNSLLRCVFPSSYSGGCLVAVHTHVQYVSTALVKYGRKALQCSDLNPKNYFYIMKKFWCKLTFIEFINAAEEERQAKVAEMKTHCSGNHELWLLGSLLLLLFSILHFNLNVDIQRPCHLNQIIRQSVSIASLIIYFVLVLAWTEYCRRWKTRGKKLENFNCTSRTLLPPCGP